MLADGIVADVVPGEIAVEVVVDGEVVAGMVAEGIYGTIGAAGTDDEDGVDDEAVVVATSDSR